MDKYSVNGQERKRKRVNQRKRVLDLSDIAERLKGTYVWEQTRISCEAKIKRCPICIDCDHFAMWKEDNIFNQPIYHKYCGGEQCDAEKRHPGHSGRGCGFKVRKPRVNEHVRSGAVDGDASNKRRQSDPEEPGLLLPNDEAA